MERGLGSGLAFPAGAVDADRGRGGLTKREYFAAHAPGCPDWFEWVAPLGPSHLMDRAFYDAHREAINEEWLSSRDAGRYVPTAEDMDLSADKWLRVSLDGGRLNLVHLPSGLVGAYEEFCEKKSVRDREVAAWRHRCLIARVVAWRWAYADAMIEAGGSA